MSTIQQAIGHMKNGDFTDAIKIYDELALSFPSMASSYKALIGKCLNAMNGRDCQSNSQYFPDIGNKISKSFSVNQFYIATNGTDIGALLVSYREMRRLGIQARIIRSCDNKCKSEDLYSRYCKTLTNRYCIANSHIPYKIMKKWQTTLSPYFFEKLMQYEKIFTDALDNGYEKIMIFDDDTFAVGDISLILDEIIAEAPEHFSVVNLGTIETFRGDDSIFELYKIQGKTQIYHPIPGYTLGSFATIYDRSVFQQLLTYIREYSGPYDCCALGAIYQRHMHDCYAVNISPFAVNFLSDSRLFYRVSMSDIYFRKGYYLDSKYFSRHYRIHVLYCHDKPNCVFDELIRCGLSVCYVKYEFCFDDNISDALCDYVNNVNNCDMVIYDNDSDERNFDQIIGTIVEALPIISEHPGNIFKNDGLYLCCTTLS